MPTKYMRMIKKLIKIFTTMTCYKINVKILLFVNKTSCKCMTENKLVYSTNQNLSKTYRSCVRSVSIMHLLILYLQREERKEERKRQNKSNNIY